MIGTHIPLGSDPYSFDEAVECERAAQALDLAPHALSRIRSPQTEFLVRHELRAVFEPISIFGCLCGPAAAGHIITVVVDPTVTARTVAALAQELQMRAALAGLDESAGALGVPVPHEYAAENMLWELARDLAPQLSQILGSSRLAAQDLESAAFAGWMARGLPNALMSPRIAPSAYVDRREHLVALSATALSACALHPKSLRGARATVLGTGTLARKTIEGLAQEGVTVIGIADESGGLMLSPEAHRESLIAHLEKGGLLAEYADNEHVRHSEVLELPTDLLLVASGAPEINESTASTLRADVVLEIGSAATTYGALEVLDARGISVIPDRLIASSLLLAELWVPQNSSRRASLVSQCVQSLWDELDLVGRKFKTPLHRSVLVLALHRLAAWDALARP